MNGTDFFNRPTESQVRSLRARAFGALEPPTAELVEELLICRFAAACTLEARDRGIPPARYCAALMEGCLAEMIDRGLATEAEREQWSIIRARVVAALGEGGGLTGPSVTRPW